MNKPRSDKPRSSSLGETVLEPHAPRFAGAIACGVHVVAALLLSWPALTGQLLLNPRSDQYKAGFAFRDFARSYFLEHGSIPQWNPYLWGGMPFVDAMHGDTFYPTALLRLILGTGPGMTWGLIIHVILAGAFSYMFLRAMRFSFFGALVGSLAYEMGGNIAGLVSPGHDGKMFVAALLPLALFLLVRGMRDKKDWAWGPLAIVVGLAVLSPHPQLLQYMLLLCGAFALFLWRGWGGDGEGAVAVQPFFPLAKALGAIAVGMLMGAIQFYPVMQYTPWSPRDGGLGYEGAIQFSLPPEETLNFALPEFSGILDAYWGRNGIHLHSEYVGIGVLLLGALAFGRAATNAHRRLTWFFGGTLVLALLWAMGGFTPFYRIVYALVPGTKFFRAPSTMLYIVAFSFAVLAALGTERILRVGLGKTVLAVGAGALALLGLMGATGMLTNTGLAIMAGERGDLVLANEPALKAGALRLLLITGIAGAAVYMAGTRRISRDLAGALLAAIVALDLWSVVKRYFIFSPPASQLFASDAAEDFLHRQTGPFRVLPLPPHKGNPNDIYLQQLNYDGLMGHRIAVPLGYHGNHIGKYDLLVDAAGGFSQLGNPNFWRLGNLQYTLSDSSELPVPGATRVAGPATNSVGNVVYVHKLPVDASYAWVVPSFIVAREDSAAAIVLDPRFDVRRAAVIDPSGNASAPAMTSLPEPLPLRARVTDYRPGAATITLDQPAPKGSVLIVSENFYPGWTAMANGKALPVARANVSLIAVMLDTGVQSVRLEFVNKPYTTGRTITWLMVLLGLAMWIGGWIVSRKRGTA